MRIRTLSPFLVGGWRLGAAAVIVAAGLVPSVAAQALPKPAVGPEKPFAPPARVEVAHAFGVMFWAVVGVLLAALGVFTLVEHRPLRATM